MKSTNIFNFENKMIHEILLIYIKEIYVRIFKIKYLRRLSKSSFKEFFLVMRAARNSIKLMYTDSSS